jgi:hypothetical protein
MPKRAACAAKVGTDPSNPVEVWLRPSLYPAGVSFDWFRLSIPDRLRLLLFDAELRRFPRPFIDALWEALDALETSSESAQTMATPADSSR